MQAQTTYEASSLLTAGMSSNVWSNVWSISGGRSAQAPS
jgi:hypothetical protein